MKIQSIYTFTNNIRQNTGFDGNKRNQHTAKRNNISNAATTFCLWFGFGVGLDFLSRKIHFSKSPTKNSFAINGILASIASLYILGKETIKNKIK